MKKRNVTIWMVVVLCLASSQVMAVIEFKDGLTHNIDYSVEDIIWIDYGCPGMGTTLNLLAGAYAHGVEAYGDSYVNIADGVTLQMWLYGYGNSQVIVSGGSISDFTVRTAGNSQIYISGGTIKVLEFVLGGSFASISGGVRHKPLMYDYHSLTVQHNCEAVWSGGLIGGDLLVEDTSCLVIQGSGFNYPLGEMTAPIGTLTGTLANGDLIHNYFEISGGGSIVLVPEPATLLLLGLGAVMVRTRLK